MTKEEFDKLDESAKKYFAKEGEEIIPLTEITDEDRAGWVREILANLAGLDSELDPKLDRWGLNESGHLQLIGG
jgi:hypothetical protein